VMIRFAEQGMLVKARHKIILPGSDAPRALWVFQKKD